MKITKEYLRTIIKEELGRLEEIDINQAVVKSSNPTASQEQINLIANINQKIEALSNKNLKIEDRLNALKSVVEYINGSGIQSPYKEQLLAKVPKS